MWMAAESSRVVRAEEQEELPASGAVTHHTHTRSQSHIQFQPLTHTTHWQQAPRALAHTRSHSHTHFNNSTPSHTQRYGCRLTHSLSAMAKGERGVQGSEGKPNEPLFPKTSQQVRSSLIIRLLVIFFYCALLCVCVNLFVTFVWTIKACWDFQSQLVSLRLRMSLNDLIG